MALALLVLEWASRRNGTVLALTVDHGLRAESGREADLTLAALAALGIPGRKLVAADLAHGPGLAERARETRYRLLTEACSADGIPHLLVGHHIGDQVETVMMRALSSSGTRGLAGMPIVTERRFVRLLRPLLNEAPARLRALLIANRVAWIEDPSNRDPGALRSRLRSVRDDPEGTGEGTLALAAAAHRAGEARTAMDRASARILGERATIRPEGYAVLTPGPIEPEVLAALLRTIAGASHASPIDRVAVLARALRPATLGGARIAPAGRLGPGWLVMRERRSMEGTVAARPGVIWDGRFRLVGGPDGFADQGPVSRLGFGGELTLGALDADAKRFRNRSGPPTLVLHGLPALRLDGMLLAVPHIGVGDPRWELLFDPRNCAAGAPFLTASDLAFGSLFGIG